jgi:hypothetical protein
LENNQKTDSKLNPVPPLDKPDGSYAETPIEKADVIAMPFASTFTPYTHPQLPEFRAIVYETVTALVFTPPPPPIQVIKCSDRSERSRILN